MKRETYNTLDSALKTANLMYTNSVESVKNVTDSSKMLKASGYNKEGDILFNIYKTFDSNFKECFYIGYYSID